MIWAQYKHEKEANNLGFGSTHIAKPWDSKYLQQFGL
jgi:hypothetical protein